jgi:hypothetical protein
MATSRGTRRLSIPLTLTAVAAGLALALDPWITSQVTLDESV